MSERAEPEEKAGTRTDVKPDGGPAQGATLTRYSYALREEARALFLAGALPADIARQLGVKRIKTLYDWVWKGDWLEQRERVRQQTARKAEARAIETAAQRTQRHLRDYRAVEAAALASMIDTDPLTGRQTPRRFLTLAEAAKALDIAVKGERLVTGEATERVATVREVILRAVAAVEGMADSQIQDLALEGDPPDPTMLAELLGEQE